MFLQRISMVAFMLAALVFLRSFSFAGSAKGLLMI